MRRPPLIEFTALNGIARSPDLVRTMSTAMRARSSWGETASSRTRPHWPPAGSNTGWPNNSVSASVDIALRILNYGADVEHYNNIHLNAAAGYVTPKDMADWPPPGDSRGTGPEVGVSQQQRQNSSSSNCLKRKRLLRNPPTYGVISKATPHPYLPQK